MFTKKSSKDAFKMKSILPLLSNEIAERFSYYGLAAILPIFLKEQFYKGAEAESATVLHLWKSCVYFCPLLGAILADVFIGKFRAILFGSMLCVAGHAMLSVYIDSPGGFLAGLFLIAVSAGIIKSNVSPFLGNQLDNQLAPQRTTVFNYLYLCINLGGAAAQIYLPYLQKHVGNTIAFIVPGLAMLIALLAFWLPNKYYIKDTGVGAAAFKKIFTKDNRIALKKAVALFVFAIIYFMLYENSSVAFVFQAQHLNLQLLPGLKLTAAQVQSANPILILLLIPLFTRIIRYRNMPIIQKIKLGFILMLVAFIIVIFIQLQIDKGYHPIVYWQLSGYLFLTASEIMVSVSCLQYAYEVAGPNIKSIITAIFYFAVSLGNLCVSGITSLIDNGSLDTFNIRSIGTNYYILLFALMAINSLIFFNAFRKKKVYHSLGAEATDRSMPVKNIA